MAEYVAVTSIADISIPMLKRCALLFSRIAVVGVQHVKENEYLASELTYLQNQEFVFEPQNSEIYFPDDPDFNHSLSLERNVMHQVTPHLLKAAILGKEDEVRSLLLLTLDATLRTISVGLRQSYKIETCPLLNFDIVSFSEPHGKKTQALEIVLKSLPVPDESTPWEQIFEYRNDPDSHHKFLDLRNWISEVARGELTPSEIEEKIEYLVSQYQRHMNLHKMKTNQSTLQTIVVSTAETAENFVKINWGQIAKSLFSLNQRKIALLEGELTSIGSEVAYIVKTKETFNP
ncbi:hypothetical protein [Nitrosomonas oligotropha]|uniref:Uncharacterized protein n=1 Tax=Nitrosomonas oligotropha TaxID=42354 RepID=A0A1H8SCH7_9PROT|nr:hypothetical protein [Nitrosomonas oligotropha]SDX11964.1 hypothetical protein SAMN05216300_11916 [Nitrosomonas oligotropha]SEO76381.1 hypothetical protein SAMN05216333_11816 [Nitrosomonas oligotropha]